VYGVSKKLPPQWNVAGVRSHTDDGEQSVKALHVAVLPEPMHKYYDNSEADLLGRYVAQPGKERNAAIRQ